MQIIECKRRPFEHQLKFNLQLRIEAEVWIDRSYIHNGIIYGKISGAVRSWNIETGQRIQEFPFNKKKL